MKLQIYKFGNYFFTYVHKPVSNVRTRAFLAVWGMPNYLSRVSLCSRVISYELSNKSHTYSWLSKSLGMGSFLQFANDTIYASILTYLAKWQIKCIYTPETMRIVYEWIITSIAAIRSTCVQLSFIFDLQYRIAGKFGELTRFEHLAKESLVNYIHQPTDY